MGSQDRLRLGVEWKLGYDLGPIRRRRRQHTMVTDQMQPRRRYQRRQFLQQLLGAQQQRRSTVSQASPNSVQKACGGISG
jgi:hypothetical protein